MSNYLRKQSAKKDQLCFKQWSRKSYAVFNSLHKEVKIGVLAFSAFTTIGTLQTRAQSDTTNFSDKIDLDEVVISAETTPQLQSEVARVVTVISKKEIQAAPGNSISDLLEFALNIDIRQRGNNGVQSDVSIRGGSFDQVMVLLNGINMTDPQTGHNMMNLPIDLTAIEKIEILQGPGARHLGANAFTGAINIITNAKKDNSVIAHLSGGENGFYNGTISASFNNGAMNHYLSIGAKGSDGYMVNTDFQKQNMLYNGGMNTKGGSLEWQAGLVNNAFGANAFYSAAYPRQFEQVQTTLGSLKYTTGDKLKFSPIIYFRQGKDRFELFRGESDLVPFNFHQSTVYGAKVNATYFSKYGKTSMGVDIRNENSLSTSLGNTPDTVAVHNYDAFYYKSYERTNYSVYAEHQLNKGALNVTFGLMAFGSSVLKDGLSFYPGIDVSYELLDGLRIKGSANRSLRMPTFTDLFYDGPRNIGNPNLKPEKAWSIESGLKYYKHGLSSHISTFYRMGTDLIDWVLLPGNTQYTTTNYTQLNTFGIETATKINLTQILNEDVFIKELKLSYSYIESDKVAQAFDSRYALDYLKHKLNFTVNHAIWHQIYGTWNVSWQDRAGTYEKYIGSETPSISTAYDPFFLVSTKVYWQKEWWRLFVEASNLLDVEYLDVSNVNQPGRWIKAGVAMKLTY